MRGAAGVVARTAPASRRRIEDGIIRLVFGMAFTYAVLSVVGLVMTLVRTLGSGRFEIRLPITLDGAIGDVTYSGSATVVGGGYSPEASFTISDVSTGLATLFTLQTVLIFVIQAVIATSVMVLGYEMLERRPFIRAFTRLVYVVAAMLAVVGSGLELLQIAIDHQAIAEITGGDPDTPLGSTFSWSFTGVWLLAGFVVAAIAVLFQIGERMQRDTEGLV